MNLRRSQRTPGLLLMVAAIFVSGSQMASGQTALEHMPQSATPRLAIVIIEGESAINNVKARTARPVVVRVEDENHRPVAGVSVAFSLPGGGPGGTFLQGGKLFTIL